VVDSGSDDGTPELARRAGARVVAHAWEGYAAQKNFALTQVKGEWVVSLDADEWLTQGLVTSLQTRLTPEAPQAGWTVPMQTYYFGRWLRHGGFWPDRHQRVFRRDRGRFSSGEKEVHEGIRVEGIVGHLDEPIGHDAYRSVRGYLEKFNRYTDLEADGWVRSGRPLYGYDMLVRPVHRWIKRMGWKGGWRDGLPGVVACTGAAAYDWVTAAKVYERRPVAGRTLMKTLLKRR